MASGSLKPEHPQPGVGTSRYRIAQYREGLPHFAVVELSAVPTQGGSVVGEYEKCWHFWHGWETACFGGIAYVRASAPGRWRITVREILGTAVDTTPATAGYAASAPLARRPVTPFLMTRPA